MKPMTIISMAGKGLSASAHAVAKRDVRGGEDEEGHREPDEQGVAHGEFLRMKGEAKCMAPS